MPSPRAKMTIECSSAGCGHQFSDRNRASLVTALGADIATVELNLHRQSTTRCPRCGATIELGLLMLDDDGVWRVSRFAGHADDVTVIAPPGGGVAYEVGDRDAPGEGRPGSERPPAPSLTGNALKLRERALAVLEGRAPKVSPAAQRDAVELALEAGVLHGGELSAASAWLQRRRG